MKIKNYILTLTALLFSLSIAAQSNRNRTLINAALHGWEYEIRAGHFPNLSQKKYAALTAIPPL